MSALLDLSGFLGVVAHGADLIAQSVLVGSIAFVRLVSLPLVQSTEVALHAGVRSTILIAAGATIATTSTSALLDAALLRASLDIPWREVAGATFVIATATKATAAAAIALVVGTRLARSGTVRMALPALAAITIAAALASSHAAARLNDAPLMLTATALHETGAALWLGGLPCFRLALLRIGSVSTLARVGRRFSRLAVVGVALILAGAAVFVARYIGSVGALAGTAYGVMAMAKVGLIAMLLLLGACNLQTVRSIGVDRDAAARVRSFVEVEMGLGMAAFVAAASMTAMPPATDIAERITWREIGERFAPVRPRLASPDHDTLALPALQAKLDRERQQDPARMDLPAYVPGEGVAPPRNDYDIAWSEYNHHWAGLFVIAMGLAAFVQKWQRARWAAHWPLLFVGLAAFLFLRADPEVWPLGDIGFFVSLHDPEVAQHRLFVLLIVGFAAFEWRVRTERIASRRPARVFPLVTAIGSVLLLAHSHELAELKDQAWVELSHMPIALLGLTAAGARWIEVAGPDDEARRAGWIWPVCFVLIGLMLLDYREA